MKTVVLLLRLCTLMGIKIRNLVKSVILLSDGVLEGFFSTAGCLLTD